MQSDGSLPPSSDPEAVDVQDAPAAREGLSLPLRLVWTGLVVLLVVFNLWLFAPLFKKGTDRRPGGEGPPVAGDRGPGPPPGGGSPRPPQGSPSPPPPGGSPAPPRSPGQASPPPPPPSPGPSAPPPSSPGPPPPPGSGGSQAPASSDGPQLGPVEIQLGILVLQRDPRLKLDAQQVKDVLAVTRAAQKPLVAASTTCLGVVRYLRADQLEFLRSHRGPLGGGRNESGKSLLERSRKLLTGRAAEGGGSLPSVDLLAAAQGGPGLSFEDIGAAPLRLEEQAALRLNSAQATEFGKAVDQLLEIDRLENEVAAQVRRILRPEQIQHIVQASAQRETARRMAPLRLLDTTLDPK